MNKQVTEIGSSSRPSGSDVPTQGSAALEECSATDCHRPATTTIDDYPFCRWCVKEIRETLRRLYG